MIIEEPSLRFSPAVIGLVRILGIKHGMGDAIALCARASDNAAWTVHHFNNLSSVARLNEFSSAHTNLILSEDIVIKLIVE